MIIRPYPRAVFVIFIGHEGGLLDLSYHPTRHLQNSRKKDTPVTNR